MLLKKVFAGLLASAMVAGIGVTAFAANASTRAYSYRFIVNPGEEDYSGGVSPSSNTYAAVDVDEWWTADSTDRIYLRVTKNTRGTSISERARVSSGGQRLNLYYTTSSRGATNYLYCTANSGNYADNDLSGTWRP